MTPIPEEFVNATTIAANSYDPVTNHTNTRAHLYFGNSKKEGMIDKSAEVANLQVSTDCPQIHLSANDNSSEEIATQLVFHKMADGTLFCEWYFHSESAKFHGPQVQCTLSVVAKEKLLKFLNDPKTY